MNAPIPKAKMSGLIGSFDRVDTAGFIGLIGGYVLLHALLRILFSPVIGTDDVTQAIYAQTLAWGYEMRQPPLYTWVQWGFDHLVGVGVHSHTLLKYLLLLLTYLFLYLTGRLILARRSTAVIAALSLWLTFPFAVSIHQGVTHSILLSALLAATVYAFVRLERNPTLNGYIGLGICIGLGLFSKYGFMVFAASFAMAALSVPRFRRILLDRRMLASLLVIVAISIPPLAWLAQHQAEAARAVSALGPQHGFAAALQQRIANLASLGSAIIQFLSPLWLFLLAFFPAVFKRPQPQTPESGSRAHRQLLGRTILIALSLLALAMLAGLLGKVSARWMHAFLLLFPLYFFARAEQAYPAGVLKRGYLTTLLVMPVIVIALWAAQTYLGPSIGKATRFHAPYDALASHLREALESPTLIVAQDEYLGGNLRLAFPQSAVVAVSLNNRLPVQATGTCLLVWQTANDSRAIPPPIETFIAPSLLSQQKDVRLWKGRYRYSDQKFLQVAYLVLPIDACHTG